MSRLERMYQGLPLWAQNAAVRWEGWRVSKRRYGPTFVAALASADNRWQAGDGIKAWQRQALTEQMRSAAQGVPYWKEAFAATGVDPERDPYGCLAALPVLSKAAVRADPGQFTNRHAAVGAQTAHTSGTTGAGLRFPVTPMADAMQWATWWRYRQWHGIARGTWCAYFGGRSLVPVGADKPPYWRVNPSGQQVLFSGYHLSERTAGAYLEVIRRRELPWIHGYPSLIALLAHYAIRAGFGGHAVRWITTGAESLLPHQRDVIHRAFGVMPRQHYGMAEGAANISECPAGRLHVDEDFSIIEFVPDDDGRYRIIGTVLANQAFPLFRYDVGDTATISAESCSCGMPGRIVETIDGRVEDYLVTRDGKRIGRLDHIFKDQTLVREAQIRQETAGACEVLLVVGEHFTDAHLQVLAREFRVRVGDGVQASFRLVNSIPRTRAGKLRFVVSSIGSLDMIAEA